LKQGDWYYIGGVLDVKRKKVGRALSRTGELFSGVENWVSGFHYLLVARKKPEIQFSSPEAGLCGQKTIKRTQKCVALGVFWYFSIISKCPYAKNIIDTAFSFLL
jgi:hypothetical protein